MSFIFRLLMVYFLFSGSLWAMPSGTTPPIAIAPAPSTVLLLAHHWKSKALSLDLKVDGSFEGRLGDGETWYGLWEMKADRKTLLLVNDPMDEEEFQKQYEVVEVSFDRLRLKDNTGKIIALYLVE